MRNILLIVFSVLVFSNTYSQNLPIYPTDKAPVIDGIIDSNDPWGDTWIAVSKAEGRNLTTDMQAKFQITYDEINLYLAFKVNDATRNIGYIDTYRNDCVQIYLSMDTLSESGKYKTGDWEIRKQASSSGLLDGRRGESYDNINFSSFKIKCIDYDNDYIQEWALPWVTLTNEMTEPDLYKNTGFIKFDIMVSDATSNGERTQQQFWNDNSDLQWNNTAKFGLVKLMSFNHQLNIQGGYRHKMNCGDSIQLSIAPTIPTTDTIFYSWSPTLGLSNTKIPNPKVGVKSTQKYYVTAHSNNGFNTTDSVLINVIPLQISAKDITASCGNTAQLNVSTNSIAPEKLTYLWSPADNLSATNIPNPIATLSKSAQYKVTVSSPDGCISEKTISVSVASALNYTPSICLVTVNSVASKNEVVWQKPVGEPIKEFRIKKQTTVAGQYNVIGTVPANSPSTFIDNASNPSKHADRYLITAIDSCDNESAPSPIHQTMYLAINQGLPGRYNLIWTPYVGFDYSTYYIYKGSSPSNLVLIDSLASTNITYTDSSASVSYYQIAVRKDAPCMVSKHKADSNPYSQSVSNLEDNLRFVDVSSLTLNNEVQVFPNPFTNKISIKGRINKPSAISIQVYNELGVLLYNNISSYNTGSYKFDIQANELKYSSNVYVLKMTIGAEVLYKKIIKN